MLRFDKFDTAALHEAFMTATPCNYVVIDDFVETRSLTEVLHEIKSIPRQTWDAIPSGTHNEPDNQFFCKKLALTRFEGLPKTGEMFRAFQSPQMLRFLSDITGIEDLENDPTLFGGGVHRIATGGRLGIHCDFNIHPGIHKYRRLNVLLYLNKDWKPSYNGEFEFWTADMQERAKTVPPIFNRMVIFRITDTAFHGHPVPWMGPVGCERLSLALYYYTEDRPEEEKGPFHWALWQKRYGLEY